MKRVVGDYPLERIICEVHGRHVHHLESQGLLFAPCERNALFGNIHSNNIKSRIGEKARDVAARTASSIADTCAGIQVRRKRSNRLLIVRFAPKFVAVKLQISLGN